MHNTNIGRIIFSLCGQWIEFLAVVYHLTRSVCSTLELRKGLWLFIQSVLVPRALGCGQAKCTCRQGWSTYSQLARSVALTRELSVPAELPPAACLPTQAIFWCCLNVSVLPGRSDHLPHLVWTWRRLREWPSASLQSTQRCQVSSTILMEKQ